MLENNIFNTLDYRRSSKYCENNIYRKITIETSTDREKMQIGESIHNQLKGNSDYINNNIIVNIDRTCAVEVFIFANCKDIPQIII